ncbi:ComF family protein [Dictyoglomus thermophilum]|uniref:Double zinc ribbon domain-containing protein n=2 Tax=Dictyoglomus thermophilum TaxID=14 RepID=B5YF18_DICT6|nr:ComF family protein [Dictyoglomus thermophilum]ACI18873.1 conserved hypothetical protein [Dictyoglomus thermophilum H-6-12]MCX7719956.1 ComF family protein [Dictyoglomus thermophilum]TYT22597.1 ComF family protein [Dictyoglomus thermophilum]
MSFFLKDLLFEILFPTRCIFCGKYSEGFVCKSCFEKLKFPKNYCGMCGRPLTGSLEICYNCSKEKKVWDSYEFVAYYDGMWKEIIASFKFKNKPYLADFISQIGKEKILKREWRIDYITYVPLSYRALVYRGYNQSEYIAHFLGKNLKIPYGPLLYLKKDIKPQKSLNLREREKNVLNAFGVIEDKKVSGNILLVDDVYTTGATLKECAKTLRENLSLNKIYVFTAVRALI